MGAPFGTGSRASHEAPNGSSPEASIPSAAEIAHLRRIVQAARQFLNHGTVITSIGGYTLQKVVENKDNSDPHYALCQAMIDYDEEFGLNSHGEPRGKQVME